MSALGKNEAFDSYSYAKWNLIGLPETVIAQFKTGEIKSMVAGQNLNTAVYGIIHFIMFDMLALLEDETFSVAEQLRVFLQAMKKNIFNCIARLPCMPSLELKRKVYNLIGGTIMMPLMVEINGLRRVDMDISKQRYAEISINLSAKITQAFNEEQVY